MVVVIKKRKQFLKIIYECLAYTSTDTLVLFGKNSCRIIIIIVVARIPAYYYRHRYILYN